MKLTVLVLSTMAALIVTSIAAAAAKIIRDGPAANVEDDYYDSGSHTVITHYSAPRRGEPG
jgi:hypothetical protein